MYRLSIRSASSFPYIVTLICAIVVFFRDAIFFNTTKIQWDVLDIHYPALVFQSRMIQRGFLPLWDPHLFCGFPYIGHVQAAVYYPVHFLMSILGEISPTQVQYLIIFHVLVAALGVFVLLRIIGASNQASMAGAFAFVFSGQLLGHTTHLGILEGISLLPATLSCVILGLQNNKKIWFILAGILLGCIAHAGHFQTAMYSAFTLYVYILFEPGRLMLSYSNWFKWFKIRFIAGLIVGLFAVGIASIVMLPTIESALDSVRNSLSYSLSTSESFEIRSLITALIPDFFGGIHSPYQGPWDRTNQQVYTGIIGCAGLLGSILFFKIRRIRFCWIFCLFGFLFALGNATPVHRWVLRGIPGFNLVRTPAAFLPIVWLHVAILIGLSLDQIMLFRHHRRIRVIVASISLSIILGIFIIAGNTGLTNEIFEARFASPLLTALVGLFVLNAVLYLRSAKSEWNTLLYICLILIMFLDVSVTYRGSDLIFGRGHPYEDFKENAVRGFINAQYALESQFRVHEWTPRSVILTNEGSIQNWYTTLGRISGIHLNRLGILIRQSEFDRQILNLLRVRFVLMPQQKMAPRVVSTAGADHSVTWNPRTELLPHSDIIFENTAALPVAFRVEDWKVAQSLEEARQLVAQVDLARTAVLETDPGFQPVWSDPGSIDQTVYTEHALSFRSSCQNPSVVVVTDTIHSGWMAYIDDIPTRILRADLALRAILIPAGDHHIRMVFNPLSFRLGGFVLMFSIMIGIIVCLCQFPYPKST